MGVNVGIHALVSRLPRVAEHEHGRLQPNSTKSGTALYCLQEPISGYSPCNIGSSVESDGLDGGPAVALSRRRLNKNRIFFLPRIKAACFQGFDV